MLDYYDFEDESGRKLIEDFILDMHHAYDNNLDQFFCRYIKHFDQPTKDYIEITWNKEKLFNKSTFPTLITKSPFFKFIIINYNYWPCFEVGGLIHDIRDKNDLLNKVINFWDYPLLGLAKKFSLEYYEDKILSALTLTDFDEKLFYGEMEYLDNLEHFHRLCIFRNSLVAQMSGFETALQYNIRDDLEGMGFKV